MISIHPSKKELMAHAENIVFSWAELAPKTVKHVAACPRCREEVEAMRHSLEFMGDAPAMEVSGDFRARLLLAARNEVQQRERSAPKRRRALTVVRTLAFAACLMLIAGVAVQSDVAWDSSEGSSLTSDSQGDVRTANFFSIEGLKIPSAVEKLLEPAVMATRRTKTSAWENQQRQKVRTLDDDISEAIAALELNPACERASELVNRTRERKDRYLVALFVERSL